MGSITEVVPTDDGCCRPWKRKWNGRKKLKSRSWRTSKPNRVSVSSHQRWWGVIPPRLIVACTHLCCPFLQDERPLGKSNLAQLRGDPLLPQFFSYLGIHSSTVKGWHFMSILKKGIGIGKWVSPLCCCNEPESSASRM